MRLLAKYHQTRREHVTERQLHVLFNFHAHTITMEIFPLLWGITLPCVIDGVPRRLIQWRMI